MLSALCMLAELGSCSTRMLTVLEAHHLHACCTEWECGCVCACAVQATGWRRQASCCDSLRNPFLKGRGAAVIEDSRVGKKLAPKLSWVLSRKVSQALAKDKEREKATEIERARAREFVCVRRGIEGEAGARGGERNNARAHGLRPLQR